MSNRIPARVFLYELMNMKIQVLLQDSSRRNRVLDEQGWTGRRVMGFKLPEWQRPEVWDDKSCVAFISNLYRGAGIREFMVNQHMEPQYDAILLDGQQRLRAIERYVASEFAVPGDDGVAYLWTELTEAEKAHFYRMNFPCQVTQYANEAILKEAYNIHNFSGVPHQPHEMAAGAASYDEAEPSMRPF